MPTLHTYQRSLLQLIKQPGTAPDADPYLAGLVTGGSIDRIRQIATWWRRQQLSRYCPLTYKALGLLGQADAEISLFYDTQAISPYIEQAGLAFLQFIQRRYDGLLRSVSQFEQAVIDTKMHRCSSCEVRWPMDPQPILHYLTADPPADLPAVAAGTYKTVHYAGATVRFDIIRLWAD